MAMLSINRDDGATNLPDGFTVGPTLTQDEFNKTPVGACAKREDCGTLPWVHYHFQAGEVKGKPLLVSLCFYDQMLVHMSLTVNLYPPGSTDWSTYSLGVEADTKRLHDELLEHILGPPTKRGRSWDRDLPERQRVLARPLSWDFAWGVISSGHDSKGGGTSIVVRYGNRHEEANRAFRVRGTIP